MLSLVKRTYGRHFALGKELVVYHVACFLPSHLCRTLISSRRPSAVMKGGLSGLPYVYVLSLLSMSTNTYRLFRLLWLDGTIAT